MKKKEKLNTLDKVLIILASYIFAFVTATMIIYTIKDWNFDTLITCVLGAGGIESVAMAGIQIAKYFKQKGGSENDTGTDNEDN